MEGERGLVRHDSSLVGPEPGGHQLLVLPRGEVDEPVDASLRASDAAGAYMLEQQL
jgi:hypothetical protein